MKPSRNRQSPFATHQELREIQRPRLCNVGPVRSFGNRWLLVQRRQNIQVIAANTTQNARPMALHGVLCAMPDLVKARDEFTRALATDLHRAGAAIAALELTKKLMRSIGQNCINSENVMNHVAVGQ